jgi:hypothetical protein
MDVQTLLSNRYVLLGGGALAVIAAVWVFSSGDTSAGDGGDAGGEYLLPFNAAPQAPGLAAGAAPMSAEAAGLDALIGLETQKAAYGYEVNLKQIDAALQMNNVTNATNLALGLAQADALNLASFSNVFSDAQQTLKGKGVTGVAAFFEYAGKTFSFNTQKVTANQRANDLTLNALAGYAGVNSGALTYAPANTSTARSAAAIRGPVAATSLAVAPAALSSPAPSPVAKSSVTYSANTKGANAYL